MLSGRTRGRADSVRLRSIGDGDVPAVRVSLADRLAVSWMRHHASIASTPARALPRGVPIQRHAFRIRTVSRHGGGETGMVPPRVGRLDRAYARRWLVDPPESSSPVILEERPLSDRMSGL